MSLADPNAPLLQCADCEDGTYACPDCGGFGGFETRHAWGSRWEPCDDCNGRGRRSCFTCEGKGEYPDPEATLRCDCGCELNDDGSCDNGCHDAAEAA